MMCGCDAGILPYMDRQQKAKERTGHMISIQLNGEPRQVRAGASIADLVT
ncbi:MAG: hypothetical protein RIQ75_825, partial [Pseudomonadota bacterium]